MNSPFTLKAPLNRLALVLAMSCTTLSSYAACRADIFLSQGAVGVQTELQRSSNTLPVAFAARGTSATRTYNALGYNPIDEQLYGTSANGNFLLRINETNGSTTELGAISGLPPSVDRFNSGAFSSAGNYYVKPFGNNAELYQINIAASPPTATLIPLTQSFTTSDMAWYGGRMYSTADNGQLYSIDVTNGTTTAIGVPDTSGDVLGAQFSGTNGFFGAANNGSGLWRINLTTGARDKISDAPASGNNDGASCPTVALFEPLPPEPGNPTSVPTLDAAGVGLLSLLGAGAGALALRRRKRTGQ